MGNWGLLPGAPMLATLQLLQHQLLGYTVASSTWEQQFPGTSPTSSCTAESLWRAVSPTLVDNPEARVLVCVSTVAS